MKTRWLSISAVALSILFMGTFAASAGGPAQQRQRNQANRIHQGVKQGAINRAGRIRLQREQQRIRNYRSGALADGRYTRQEYRRVDRMQDRASRHIYTARRHHADRRGPQNHRRSYPAYQDHYPGSHYAFELNLLDPGFFIGFGARGCR